MRKIDFYGVFAALGLSLSFSSPAMADLASDSQKSAQWFSQELGDLLAFQAASTHFLPGDTVGFPGVEAGIAGGVTAMKLDEDGYRTLSFDTLDSNEADLPSAIGAPSGVLHVKAGLPWGLDIGLKGGTARVDADEGDAKIELTNKIFGIEVRKRLLGGGLTGAALPDLSLSLAMDSASGDITRTERYDAGVQSGGNLVADTTWKSEWDLKAVTLRAVISKKVIFLTPFAGVGITKTSGDTETTVTIDEVGGNAGLGDVSSRGTAETDEKTGHLIAGLEVAPLPFCRLNLSGLVAKEKFAVSLGLRVQFP